MGSTVADSEVCSDAGKRTEALKAQLREAALSTPERINLISEAVSRLQHANVEDDVLFKSALEFHQAVAELNFRHSDHLIGLMLPANEEDTEYYHQCSQLYADLVSVCERVIQRAPKDFEQDPQELERITQACYWEMRFLGERLRCAYCSYTHAPVGIWLQIHQLYQQGLKHGLTKVRIRAESKLRHLAHVYKRLLLLGICDPYQFPFRSIDSVFDALDDWAKLAHLKMGKPVHHRCVFLINPDADRPAVPLLPKLSLGVDSMYFDTSPLVDVLNLDLKTHADIDFTDVKHRSGTELETQEVLKNLIVSWGVHPPREVERENRNGVCDLVTGLSSIVALLAPEPKNGEPRFNIHRSLQLIDESKSGARVCVTVSDNTYVRVGELIAVKSEHAGNWSIGMVRWGQTDIDNRFCIGIYKLIDNAVPLTIVVEDGGGKTFSRPVRAIWTNRSTENESAPTLIVDAKYFRSGGRVRVRREDEASYFKADRIILSTRYFVWFEINPLDRGPGIFRLLESRSAGPGN